MTTRVSERDLTRFMEALSKRDITDRPAALRHLMRAADKILTPADQATIDKLKGRKFDIQTRGGGINHIARKLNEAKLSGRPIPYTIEDAATIRSMVVFLFDFMEQFRVLWDAQRAAMTREVDKALAGLGIRDEATAKRRHNANDVHLTERDKSPRSFKRTKI